MCFVVLLLFLSPLIWRIVGFVNIHFFGDQPLCSAEHNG
jgi:hypothetical protein